MLMDQVVSLLSGALNPLLASYLAPEAETGKILQVSRAEPARCKVQTVLLSRASTLNPLLDSCSLSGTVWTCLDSSWTGENLNKCISLSLTDGGITSGMDICLE